MSYIDLREVYKSLFCMFCMNIRLFWGVQIHSKTEWSITQALKWSIIIKQTACTPNNWIELAQEFITAINMNLATSYNLGRYCGMTPFEIYRHMTSIQDTYMQKIVYDVLYSHAGIYKKCLWFCFVCSAKIYGPVDFFYRYPIRNNICNNAC